MNPETVCPFSKPIIGQWCQCRFARLGDRCSGKMLCCHTGNQIDTCLSLSDTLIQQSRFILGLSNTDAGLTHAQLMKVRCGGLQGMQRVLGLNEDKMPVVLDLLAAIDDSYGDMTEFPFEKIMQDIKLFSSRKRSAVKGGQSR